MSLSISAPPPPLAALRAVCAAHALARWAWRTWEFAVALILIRLSPTTSLLSVSAYGLADNVARVAFGGAAGAYVDREERLRGACACVLLQNACILASALAAGALLLAGGGGDSGGAPAGPDSAAAAAGASAGAAAAPAAGPHPALFWPLIAVVVGAGAMSSVGSAGAAAAVEREWVKALCGDDAPLLARVNSGAAAAAALPPFFDAAASARARAFLLHVAQKPCVTSSALTP